MKFWDSSALVALALAEPSGRDLEKLIAADQQLAVWWGSRVECASAVRRRQRSGILTSPSAEAALKRIREYQEYAFQVDPTDAVRDRAESLLAGRALTASDALQLAAALAWCDGRPSGRGFVCLDRRLGEVAAAEGFALAPAA